MKKNILFINHSVRDGGPGRSLFYLLKHFDFEKFNVHALLPSRNTFSENIERENLQVNQIINSDFPENLKKQNFTIKNRRLNLLPVDILINLFKLVCLLFSFGKTLKKHDIHIIYCNGTLAKFFGALLGRMYSINVVWHVRNIQQKFLFKYLINKFSNYECVKKIICVSIATQNQFESKEKTVVINNGIDTEEYSSSEVQNLLREEYGISSKKMIIGTVGRVVPRKNFEHFVNIGIETCTRYKKDCLFVLVGDTPFYFNQSFMDKLKLMVKEANLESKFLFTGYKERISSYMADFDIFIIPSMYPDPFPRVAIESMALGKPVLGYKVGGVDEIIDDGINGYSFDLEDESLINKLIDLIEDRELRLKMSFEARKKAVSNYDSRVIATKILSEIESLSS